MWFVENNIRGYLFVNISLKLLHTIGIITLVRVPPPYVLYGEYIVTGAQ